MNILSDNSGIFLIDKPYQWTSFDVVGKMRSLLKAATGKKIKVGHAGTLDPLATGLMIVCVGKKTKNIQQYMQYDKEYIATVNFSGSTASADLEKPIEQQYEYSHLTYDLVKNTINKFTGQLLQIPPAFSAKWVDGKRAYVYARKGTIPDLKPVPVTIEFIHLLEFNPPECVFQIRCSKGTYIRSLVRDLGIALTGGAHLTALKRTAIGPFNLTMAISVEDFEKMLSKQICN